MESYTLLLIEASYSCTTQNLILSFMRGDVNISLYESC